MKKTAILSCALALALGLTACGGGESKATSEPFPEFTATDFEGNTLSNDMFAGYDVTIVNFWSNGCGSCIEEMPDLEAYYQDFKGQNINLIGVATSAGESEKEYDLAAEILEGKGVTYTNLIPDIESDFYTVFIKENNTYPMTLIVDSEGNIIGAPIYGVLAAQEDKLMTRIESILEDR